MISETILTLIDDVGKDMDKFLHCFRASIFAKLIYFAWDLFILLQSEWFDFETCIRIQVSTFCSSKIIVAVTIQGLAW